MCIWSRPPIIVHKKMTCPTVIFRTPTSEFPIRGHFWRLSYSDFSFQQGRQIFLKLYPDYFSKDQKNTRIISNHFSVLQRFFSKIPRFPWVLWICTCLHVFLHWFSQGFVHSYDFLLIVTEKSGSLKCGKKLYPKPLKRIVVLQFCPPVLHPNSWNKVTFGRFRAQTCFFSMVALTFLHSCQGQL